MKNYAGQDVIHREAAEGRRASWVTSPLPRDLHDSPHHTKTEFSDCQY